MGSGSDTSGVLSADKYVTERSGRLKVFKLVGTLLTAFGGLAFAAYIEAIERFTELNQWILGGVTDFGVDVVRDILGKSASLQAEAFTNAAKQTVLLGPFRPWLFAIEALLVTALFALTLRVVID